MDTSKGNSMISCSCTHLLVLIRTPMTDAFFTTEDGLWFSPTDHTRGPWSPDHCHAGPPTGLVARAMEALLPDQRLTRLTINLIRPIPHRLMRVESTCDRQGRTVSLTSARLLDNKDIVCATASGLFMTPQPAENFPTQTVCLDNPETAIPGPFPIQQTLHPLPAFNGTGVETRYPAGENEKPGPTTAWLKTVPLISDEVASPFQRICPLADCGNAFGRNAEPVDFNFMNPDLTLLLHRDPEGEWFGSRSSGYWENNGIGMSDAQLFDHHGSVGRALQTLFIRKTQPVARKTTD